VGNDALPGCVAVKIDRIGAYGRRRAPPRALLEISKEKGKQFRAESRETNWFSPRCREEGAIAAFFKSCQSDRPIWPPLKRTVPESRVK
jgi:hypothetical protein